MKLLLFALMSLIPMTGMSDNSFSPLDPSVRFQFAIYFTQAEQSNPIDYSKKYIADKLKGFELKTELDKDTKQPALSLRYLTDAQKTYAPPDMASIDYFGRGISKDQAQRLQAVNKVLTVDFYYPTSFVWEGMRHALGLMYHLASHYHGLVWDEQTREIFSPQAWKQRRMSNWDEPVPDIRRHTVIHAYKQNNYIRAISLGMRKFGLPDVVVNDFSWSIKNNIEHLVYLSMQLLAEGNSIINVDDNWMLDFDVNKLQHRVMKTEMISHQMANANEKVMLMVRPGNRERGDPYNRLLEIIFDNVNGAQLQERQQALMTHLFGWRDSVMLITHNHNILQASKRAKAKLVSLKQAFRDGLQPGGHIQLKAPFDTPDGKQEWMWVEVISWQGKEIKGLLKNEPYNIPSLKGGSRVTIDEESVFDYIRYYPDGRQEGNETGKLIMQLQTEK